MTKSNLTGRNLSVHAVYSKPFRCETYSSLIGRIIEHLIAIRETHFSELYFGKKNIFARTYQLIGLILTIQSHWDFGFETFCFRSDNNFIAEVSSIKFRGNISPMINLVVGLPKKWNLAFCQFWISKNNRIKWTTNRSKNQNNFVKMKLIGGFLLGSVLSCGNVDGK